MNLFNKTFIFIFILFHFSTCASKKNTQTQNVVLAFALLSQQPKSISPTIIFSIPTSVSDTVTSAPNHNGDAGVFRDRSKAINGIRGGGLSAGSLDVFSLSSTGLGASIVLEWKDKRVLNGAGVDFIVFENAFLYNNNVNSVFMEPIIVEVSIDNISYCGFSPNYTNIPETVYSNNPIHWTRFAGITPVKYNMETNILTGNDLFDVSKTGGDGFDLDDLSSTNDYNIGCSVLLRDTIKTNGFLYLRLTSATSRINSDTGANFLQDTGAFGGGPDIDGVIAKYNSNR